MANISKRKKDFSRNKYKTINDHHDFLERITKSLYYGTLPSMPCLSLPVTELSAELFSEAQKGRSLKRLHVDEAAELSRSACVSPCSLVLALLYLERLKSSNPQYVSRMAPSQLFLVSLMVSNKFLQDDGEEDEVFSCEWATSAGITSEDLHRLERDFLHAIDWRIFVNDERFETALEWLEQRVALKQSKSRGWFTYTDLTNISNTIECFGLMKCLMTVYLALSVSYLASISTLVASSLIVSHSSMAILNNPSIFSLFNVNFSNDDKSTNSNDTDTEHSANIVSNSLIIEEQLKEAAAQDIQSRNVGTSVDYHSLKFCENKTLNLISYTHYDFWLCSNRYQFNGFFKQLLDAGFVNYFTNLFKELIYMDDKISKKDYIAPNHWLPHWKMLNYKHHSMIKHFPEIVSMTC